jgi:hypothetical protein
MKKWFILVVVFVFSFPLFSQNLNDYKYAMIPSTFSFLKEKDQYKLNTVTKLFMEKYGFESYLDTDILPSDFAKDNCNKVYVTVEENNSFMVTKLKVVLKDCKNNVLFFSKEGKSREKEYKVAYTQALREAFSSLDELKHKYNGNVVSDEPTTTLDKNSENQGVNEVKPIQKTENNSVNSSNGLFAQSISNGYQLINSVPKVIYKIYATSVKNYFIAIKGNLQGIFFLKDKEWFFEYYKDDKLTSEKVDVTF